jgi:hypothetical protein
VRSEQRRTRREAEKEEWRGGGASVQASHGVAPGLNTDHVGFVVDTVELRQFSPSASVSPTISHFATCSILVYRLGLVEEAA